MKLKWIAIACVLILTGLLSSGCDLVNRTSSQSDWVIELVLYQGGTKMYKIYDTRTNVLCYASTFGGIDCKFPERDEGEP